MKELKIGQIVYLKPVGNNKRYLSGSITNHIQESEIEKIGTKYFHLKDFYKTKFSIKEMINISSYSPEWKVYTDKQQILDEEEEIVLTNNIKKIIKDYNSKPRELTLDQLRRINQIITE